MTENNLSYLTYLDYVISSWFTLLFAVGQELVTILDFVAALIDFMSD
jgi:hypothetical protein